MAGATSKPDKIILFTNLDYVCIGDVRTRSHAAYLQAQYNPRLTLVNGPRFRFYGFGTETSNPTFDIDVPSIDYKLISAASAHTFIGDSGKARPISSGAIMKIEGFDREIQLVVGRQELPIEIETFEFDSEDHDWEHFHLKVTENVAKYWIAPNMPLQMYQPIEIVRLCLKSKRLLLMNEQKRREIDHPESNRDPEDHSDR